ncbi:glycosyltransferase family 39 protein [Herbiconiux sp. SYSU D00978]|uniref:glycosyltransferase family 39 protein n=1 Tax=Herbiconiux sp. SYSU D00978 TaxID=2812562 RepID=UPI001A96591E|nr:glycosyltransferase family 39 protein [Herbiconiux sp. SYSU D00978]
MSSTSAAPARRRWLLPLLLGLATLAVSLPGITGPSIWYDEAATVVSATRPLPALWEMVGNVDAVHALYYVVMHALFEVFGYSELLLRLPSAIATGATAALVVELGRRLVSLRFGVLAGVAFAVLPRVTWMAIEGRSYALSALLAVGLTLVLVLAMRGRAWWWALYGALALLSVITFIYLALLVVAHAVTVALWLLVARREAVRGAVLWLVASGTAALASLPFALEVVSQNGQVGWIPELGDQTWRQVFRTQWFLYNDLFAWVGWLVLAVAIVLLLRGRRALVLPAAAGAAPALPAAAVLLPALVVPTLGLLAMTEFYSPVYSPRYVTMCTPFVALVMAAAIERLLGRVALSIALAASLVLAVPEVIDQRDPHSKQNTAWDEISAFLARDIDDPVTTGIVYGNLKAHSKASTRVIAYSYPEGFEGTTDVTLETPAPETGQLWETRRTLTQSLDRLEGLETVYLVTSISRDRRAATTAALTDEGYELADERRFTDVRVLRYEKAD